MDFQWEYNWAHLMDRPMVSLKGYYSVRKTGVQMVGLKAVLLDSLTGAMTVQWKESTKVATLGLQSAHH